MSQLPTFACIFGLLLGIALAFYAPRAGFLLALFLIPYEGIRFASTGLAINSFYVVGYSAAWLVRTGFAPLAAVPHRNLLLAMVCWTGVSLFASGFTDSFLAFNTRDISPLRAALRYLVPSASAALFYVVAAHRLLLEPRWTACLACFAASVSYYTITYIFSWRLQMDIPLPLQATLCGGDITLPNFSGYNGASGLVAEYLVVVFLFGLILLAQPGIRIWTRLLALVSMAATIPMLLETTSRAALGALGAGTLLIVGIQIWHRRFGWFQALSASAVVAGLCAMILYTPLGDLIKSKIEVAFTGGYANNASSFDAISNRPYVRDMQEVAVWSGFVGNGPFQAGDMNGSLLVSHSLYVSYLARTGAVGLFLLLLFIGSVLWGGVSAARDDDPTTRYHALVFISILSCLLVGELFNAYDQEASSAMMFALLYGFIAALESRCPSLTQPQRSVEHPAWNGAVKPSPEVG